MIFILTPPYTFLISHKNFYILVIYTMIYNSATIPKHFLTGENFIILGSMHFVFPPKRYMNDVANHLCLTGSFTKMNTLIIY